MPQVLAPTGYSRTQIVLLWVIAALIIAQFVLHDRPAGHGNGNLVRWVGAGRHDSLDVEVSTIAAFCAACAGLFVSTVRFEDRIDAAYDTSATVTNAWYGQ